MYDLPREILTRYFTYCVFCFSIYSMFHVYIANADVTFPAERVPAFVYTNLFVCIFWRTDERTERNWQLCVAGLFFQYLGRLHSAECTPIARAAKKAFERRLTVTLIDAMTSRHRRNMTALIRGQPGEHFSSRLEGSGKSEQLLQ